MNSDFNLLETNINMCLPCSFFPPPPKTKKYTLFADNNPLSLADMNAVRKNLNQNDATEK